MSKSADEHGSELDSLFDDEAFEDARPHGARSAADNCGPKGFELVLAAIAVIYGIALCLWLVS